MPGSWKSQKVVPNSVIILLILTLKGYGSLNYMMSIFILSPEVYSVLPGLVLVAQLGNFIIRLSYVTFQQYPFQYLQTIQKKCNCLASSLEAGLISSNVLFLRNQC